MLGMKPIEIRHLTKRFGDIAAVDDVSFQVSAGRVTGFLGRNGSGKSTTMRVLLGLCHPTSGRATFWGQPYDELPDPIRRVGAAIDPHTMHPSRSGAQHLKVMATAARLPHTRVSAVLSLVGLEHAATRRVGGYSMGMRQRLTLAAALLGDPEVIVLDEPLNGLDPDGIVWVRTFVRQLAGEGRTVFLSSHLLGEVANSVDDVVVIDRGRLVAASSLADLVGGARTVARTPDPEELVAVLVAAGHRASRTAVDEITASTVSPEVVGRLAARAGLTILALSESRDGLEQVFHELTNVQEATS